MMISGRFSIGHHTDAVLQCSPRQLQQVFPTRNVKKLGGYKASGNNLENHKYSLLVLSTQLTFLDQIHKILFIILKILRRIFC